MKKLTESQQIRKLLREMVALTWDKAIEDSVQKMLYLTSGHFPGKTKQEKAAIIADRVFGDISPEESAGKNVDQLASEIYAAYEKYYAELQVYMAKLRKEREAEEQVKNTALDKIVKAYPKVMAKILKSTTRSGTFVSDNDLIEAATHGGLKNILLTYIIHKTKSYYEHEHYADYLDLEPYVISVMVSERALENYEQNKLSEKDLLDKYNTYERMYIKGENLPTTKLKSTKPRRKTSPKPKV